MSQYVVPGLEATAGAVSEYFAPGNPAGTELIGSGVGQLAGGAAGGNQGQSLGGMLGGLGGGLGSMGFGGSSGGGLMSSLGGLFGGGGGASPDPSMGGAAPAFSGMQPAGTLAGQPYFSADQYANYGPNAPGSTGPGFANSASFAPPVPPPPANLSPSGGGAGAPPTSTLSPTGGGPKPASIDPNALSASLNAPAQGSIGAALAAPNASTGGGDPSTPWYANPSYWQGAGTVGAAYLKYLSESGKQELARPFQSSVIAPTYNPLAGARSSPIQPPTLTV